MQRAKESLLPRLTKHYRPVVGNLEESIPAASSILVDLHTGRLCFEVVPGATTIRIMADVRSRDPQLGRQISVVTERDGTACRIRFTGPFTVENRTSCSIDALIQVPPTTTIDATCFFGRVTAKGVSTDFAAHSSMGRMNVTLAPDWTSGKLDLSTSMGDVNLSVPQDARLRLDSGTSLGRCAIGIESRDDGSPTRLRTSLGNIRVRSA